MKAYIWLSILILSVIATGLLFSRTLPGTPATVHAEAEEAHTVCAEGHDHHAAAGADHPQHAEEGAHNEGTSAKHVENKHAGHSHAQTEETEESHASDPHAGHAHAAAADGICPEHQVPEAQDALCLADHIGELQPGAGMLVRLASAQVAARAGIRTINPESAQLSTPLEVPARLTFARERIATLTPQAAGTVHKVFVRPGSRINQGELLLQISTPEIARLQAEYRAAVAQHTRNSAALKREEDLYANGISAAEEVQRARSAWSTSRSEVKQYRRELQSFGLDADHMDESTLVPVRAPFAGVITRVNTSGGEVVSPASPLLTLADPEILWLELSIPAAHAASVMPHTPVQVSFDSIDGPPLETELFHVDPALNPESRTLRALAQIPNPEGRLKAGMFVHATLLRTGSSAGVSLPTDAVQHIDGRSYIFIQHEPDLFELRRVTTSALQDGRIGISAGIEPEAKKIRVVSARGFALKSEVLRARLGASCADH